jgi:hypothetical protein
MSISGRLYGGFGALVLFGAALAGFAVWQLGAIQDQVADMTVQSKNTIRAGEIVAELHAIRRATVRYAFDQDEASFADSEQRSTKVAALLGDAVNTTKSAERRAVYGEVAKMVTELSVKRSALHDAFIKMQAGRALLFTDGDKLAIDVKTFVDAARDSPIAQAASELESRVLLVRVAN